MYALASNLSTLPIISLQTGETVAGVLKPVIDHSTLEVLAYLCQAPKQSKPLVLMSNDIRQMAVDCMIIDSEEELTEAGDIVRIAALLKQNFSPVGKTVVTDLERRLGRVDDYTINLDSNRIQKLHVRPPFLRSLLGSSVVVDRTQIIDVTTRHIIVRDSVITVPLLSPEPAPETNP